jgi:phage head maturation protease
MAPKNGDETRSFKREIRSTESGRKVIGYPIVFNVLSEDLGGFRERILAGAVEFDPDIRADFNHDPDHILGRRAAGTLRLTTDNKGVRMEADARRYRPRLFRVSRPAGRPADNRGKRPDGAHPHQDSCTPGVGSQ